MSLPPPLSNDSTSRELRLGRHLPIHWSLDLLHTAIVVVSLKPRLIHLLPDLPAFFLFSFLLAEATKLILSSSSSTSSLDLCIITKHHLLCFIYLHFRILRKTSEDFGRLQKTSEDFGRFRKTSEDFPEDLLESLPKSSEV
ncbi:hypothetical protein Bca101_067297 [Brassica carinata]